MILDPRSQIPDPEILSPRSYGHSTFIFLTLPNNSSNVRSPFTFCQCIPNPFSSTRCTADEELSKHDVTYHESYQTIHDTTHDTEHFTRSHSQQQDHAPSIELRKRNYIRTGELELHTTHAHTEYCVEPYCTVPLYLLRVTYCTVRYRYNGLKAFSADVCFTVKFF